MPTLQVALKCMHMPHMVYTTHATCSLLCKLALQVGLKLQDVQQDLLTWEYDAIIRASPGNALQGSGINHPLHMPYISAGHCTMLCLLCHNVC